LDRKKLESFGLKIISDNLIKYDQSVIRHDERKLANLIMQLLP